jgi:hypothetical protein
LALHAFPYVAQSRRAAAEPCQSTGKGLEPFASVTNRFPAPTSTTAAIGVVADAGRIVILIVRFGQRNKPDIRQFAQFTPGGSADATF